jgi:hypothetical protein
MKRRRNASSSAIRETRAFSATFRSSCSSRPVDDGHAAAADQLLDPVTGDLQPKRMA